MHEKYKFVMKNSPPPKKNSGNGTSPLELFQLPKASTLLRDKSLNIPTTPGGPFHTNYFHPLCNPRTRSSASERTKRSFSLYRRYSKSCYRLCAPFIFPFC